MVRTYSCSIVNALRFAESKDDLMRRLNEIIDNVNEDNALTGNERRYLQSLALVITAGAANTPDIIFDGLFKFNL